MYKLEQQIIEMENFASHLEEVFITVEVRAARGAHQTHLASVSAWDSSRVRCESENLLFLECVVSLPPLSLNPAPPSASTLGLPLMA